jgi:uncharacterized membrane protein YdjX (TVP38/TMEM64 family)
MSSRPLARVGPRSRLAVLAAVVAGSYAALALSGPVSVGRVRGLVGAHAMFAPVVFVAVSASLTLASFPGPLLAGASGLLFGTAEGTALALLAATLGATAAHQLARHAAGDWGVRAASGRLGAAAGWQRERGFVAVLYARILPAMPFALVSYAAGVVGVALRAFIPATVLGAAPRAFAYTALGGHLGNLDQPEALIAIGVLIGMGVAGLVIARRNWGGAGAS